MIVNIEFNTEAAADRKALAALFAETPILEAPKPAAKPEPAKPEPAKPEPAKPEPAKPEPAKPAAKPAAKKAPEKPEIPVSEPEPETLPESEPEQEELPEEETADEGEPSEDEVKKLRAKAAEVVTTMVSEGRSADVREALNSVGAKRASVIEPSKLKSFLASLEY